MLLKPPHVEDDKESLMDLIQTYPLGVLTSAIPNDDGPTIQVTHLPFILDRDEGVLRAHIARMNPHAKILSDAYNASKSSGKKLDEVLVLFTGIDHYVTPKFYVETKPDTGRVVPTWNYAAAQAYGDIRVFDSKYDDKAGDFLQKQVEDLSDFSEKGIMKYDKPWQVSDAPESYVETLKKNIIGIEISITSLSGKYKMTQEMKPGDRKGVIDGFASLKTEKGDAMSSIISEREKIMLEKQ